MPVYNKLVRDRIPEIINNSGKWAITRQLSDEEYKEELRRKIREELMEYFSTNTDEDALEELADLLEIIHSLVKVHGTNMDQLEQIRYKKAEERGSFDKRIFLIEVKDE